MGDPFIRHIALLGFEKRYVPSQHYVSTGLRRPARGDRTGGAQVPVPAQPRDSRPETRAAEG